MRLQKEASPIGEITAFVVRDLVTGEIVHHELLDSGQIPAGSFVSTVMGRVADLEREYPHPRYEVLEESFSSLDAFYHFYPHCAPREQEGTR